MAILSIPTITGIRRSRFGKASNTRAYVSPFNGRTQTAALDGERWLATYTLPAMKREKAAIWIAWLNSLRGMAGRFYGYDPDATTPRGAAAGTPVVDGGSQTGLTLNTTGWDTNVTGILKAGDYIAFDVDGGDGRVLRQLTADADSDGSGDAALSLDAPVRAGRSPINGETIITAKASCVMMLDDDTVQWDADEGGIFTITFGGIEAYGA